MVIEPLNYLFGHGVIVGIIRWFVGYLLRFEARNSMFSYHHLPYPITLLHIDCTACRYNVVSDFDQSSAPVADNGAEPAVEVMVVDNSALRHLEILENLSSETGT